MCLLLGLNEKTVVVLQLESMVVVLGPGYTCVALFCVLHLVSFLKMFPRLERLLYSKRAISKIGTFTCGVFTVHWNSCYNR